MKRSLRLLGVLLPLFAMCLLISTASADPPIDLGTLGGSSSMAYGLNERPEAPHVVGVAQTGSENSRAFRGPGPSAWVQDLGTLGGTNSVAHAVNNFGEVVGAAYTIGNHAVRAFFWKDSNRNGMSDPGEMGDLGTLGGANSYAYGINDHAQIVGAAQTLSSQYRACLWKRGAAAKSLGTLGGANSYAYGINNRGQIVGAAQTKTGAYHAFLWSAEGGMVDLGTLGGANSYAYGINNRGQIVGAAQTKTGAMRAFLWKDGVMQDLGALGGEASYAHGINDQGEVVGKSLVSSGAMHAFLWSSGGGMRDANSLLPAGSGWVLAEARGINREGCIVGWGLRDGQVRAYLWKRMAGSGIQPLVVVSFERNGVAGGSRATAVLTLKNSRTGAVIEAPPGGAVCRLSSLHPATASVPETVTIPEGKTNAAFPVITAAVTRTVSVEITAEHMEESGSATLTIHPAVKALTLQPATVAGCQRVDGKVTLNGPASSPLVIALHNTNPAATLSAASVTIPAGTTSRTFTLQTTPVATRIRGAVTAGFGGISKRKTLTVRPIGVQSLSFSASSVKGGGSITGTVVLECPAAPGDIVVTLTSSQPAVAQFIDAEGHPVNPLLLTAPHGATKRAFLVRTSAVSSPRTVTITAEANGIGKQKSLTVNP